MAWLVLDDQLGASEVLGPIRKLIQAVRLRDLRPGERILDDRVPGVLLSLKDPMFITIDQGFWDRRYLHPGYCILYFALRDEQQELLPELLRRTLRARDFKTRAARRGKIGRVSRSGIDYWRLRSAVLHRVPWN